jgi:hypothetical protein
MEQQPDQDIILPSSLRIIQRLGQVSTNASMKQHLYPNIASHEREQFTPEQFVGMLADHIVDYAEEHVLGIAGLFLNRMPEFIVSILDKDEDKGRALHYWMEQVEKSKEGEIDRDRIIKKYLAGDSPRKMKKQKKKESPSSEHSARGHKKSTVWKKRR